MKDAGGAECVSSVCLRFSLSNFLYIQHFVSLRSSATDKKEKEKRFFYSIFLLKIFFIRQIILYIIIYLIFIYLNINIKQ